MILFSRPVRIFFQSIGVVTVIGVIAAAGAAWFLPRLLQVEDRIEKADFIVPLAGDAHRLIKAAELYKAGYAPKIILSNSRIRPPSRLARIRKEMGFEQPRPREMRRRLLRQLGIFDDALESFGKGHVSTAEEAEAFRDFLKARKTEKSRGTPLRVILVTSPYHARRAKMTFEATMPEIRFMVTSPPEGRLKARWWRDQRSAQLAVSEGLKIVFYLLGGQFRSAAAQP